MNKNVKIAKELIKIARELTAEYEYEDDRLQGEGYQFIGYEKCINITGKFFGKIVSDYYSDKDFYAFEVKNATLKPNYRGYLQWEKGTWKDGTFFGTWKDGTWEKGRFFGTWEGGTWENGYFYGTWEGGTWENGDFDGTWKGGYDKNGKYHGEGDSPNKWDK